MKERYVYAVTVAVAISLCLVYVSGSEADLHKESKVDGFQVPQLLADILKKHFPDKHTYPNYKGPKLEEYGHIDYQNNRYVFLSDKNDVKAQYFKRDLKAKLGDHILIKDSKIPYLKLMAVQHEISTNYDTFQVDADIIEQKVKVRADFTKAEKKELLHKYGSDVVEVEIFDPGAVAADQDSTWLAGRQELVQQVGAPNDKVYWPPSPNRLISYERVAMSPFSYREIESFTDEVYEKTGFPKFSGKLFDEYGTYVHSKGELPEGRLTYGINRLPKGMKARISLIELHPDLTPVREIWSVVYDHPHGMNVEFPDRKNVMFSLRLELLDKNDETVDAKMNFYAFELDEINAKLEIDADAYDQSGVISYSLTNWGPTALENDDSYSIQKWESGRWMLLNGWGRFLVVLDIARGSTLPNKVYEGKIAVKYLSLEPGKYRLVKQVEANEGTASAILCAPFEIVS